MAYFKLPSLWFRRRKKAPVDLETLFLPPEQKNVSADHNFNSGPELESRENERSVSAPVQVDKLFGPVSLSEKKAELSGKLISGKPEVFRENLSLAGGPLSDGVSESYLPVNDSDPTPRKNITRPVSVERTLNNYPSAGTFVVRSQEDLTGNHPVTDISGTLQPGGVSNGSSGSVPDIHSEPVISGVHPAAETGGEHSAENRSLSHSFGGQEKILFSSEIPSTDVAGIPLAERMAAQRLLSRVVSPSSGSVSSSLNEANVFSRYRKADFSDNPLSENMSNTFEAGSQTRPVLSGSQPTDGVSLSDPTAGRVLEQRPSESLSHFHLSEETSGYLPSAGESAEKDVSDSLTARFSSRTAADGTPEMTDHKQLSKNVFGGDREKSSEIQVEPDRNNSSQLGTAVGALTDCVKSQLRYLRKNYELLKSQSEDRFFN